MGTTIDSLPSRDEAAPSPDADEPLRAVSPIRRLVRFLGLPGLGILGLYLLSRVFLIVLSPPVTDIPLYYIYGLSCVDFGAEPYNDDVGCEYPPLALAHFAGIRALDDQRYLRTKYDRSTREIALSVARVRTAQPRIDYARRFRLSLLLVDLLVAGCGAWLVARRYGRAALFRCAVAYILGTLLLGHVLYDRTDLIVMLSLVAAAAAWLRLADLDAAGTGERPSPRYYLLVVAAYGALGLGTAYKLLPLLVAGPLLCCEAVRVVRRRPGAPCVALTAAAAFAVAAVGPFAYFALRSGNELSTLFRYHGDRPIEIESIWSGIVLATRALRPDLHVELVHSYGSFNLLGPTAEALHRVAPWAMLAGWSALIACSLRGVASYDRRAAFCAGGAVLLWGAATAHVLSPQYLLWMLLMAALMILEMRARRLEKWFVVATVVLAGLTTYVFPYHFQTPPPQPGVAADPNPPPTLIPDFDPLPVGVLIARNLLLAAIIAGLVVMTCRFLWCRAELRPTTARG